MSVQTDKHKCEGMPDYVYVNRHRIDGEWTEWCVAFSAHSREGSSSSTLYITHCPYCGKEL